MASFVLALGVTVLLWSISKFLYATWWRPKILERKLMKRGIHGPSYKFLYGNAKEIMELTAEARRKNLKLSHDIVHRVDPFLYMQTMSYKSPFVVWYGTTPRVSVMEPKLIKDILSRTMDFQKPHVHWSMKLFLNGLANIDGEKWARHRKIINPAFHMEKLKRMLPAFMTSSEEMVEKWDSLIGPNGSLELDVFPEFQDLTGDVISRAAFGSNLEEGRQIFTLQREQAQLFMQSLYTSNLPWSRYLPTGTNLRMKQIHKEVASILGEMIDDREKAITSGKNEYDDLLTQLLRYNMEEQRDKGKALGMTREDVTEECKLFYFAGHETTANLLTWAMVALSMHQDWQDKARDEVLRLVAPKNKPTFEDLGRLKIVHMVLLEVLRLYPPTSIVRRTTKETQVGDVSVPAGVDLQIPLYMVHRDAKQWGEDANEFRPERFADGISKASKDVSFFSFGWGPRICIGQQFAMVEAKLALAMILQRFTFQLSPVYCHAPFVCLTLQPQYGAQVVLRKVC